MRFRWRIMAAALFLSATLTPTKAHAFVFTTIIGAIGGALAAAGVITPLIGVGSIAAVNAGFAIGAFLATGVGQLLVAGGATALRFAFSGGRGGPGAGPQRQAPSAEAAKVNVRIREAERWWHAGIARSGGAALFGEYDNTGAFWYLVVHGDAELIDTVQIMLDDRPVELDGSKDVITDEFVLDYKGNAYGGAGTKFPFVRIWTTTYTEADPIPPAISAFKAKFSEWTDDHVLAGTCFSIVRVASIKIEDRYKIFRWRGPFGLGEPSVSIVGQWTRCYDPREVSHDIEDPTTWEFTRNPALIWARFRTYRYGRNKPMSSVNWTRVAEQADICDQTVLDKDENEVVRYQCGISIPESKERHIAEAEILLSCDGMILFDSEGKAYPKVGYYEAPALTLTRNRDIVAMASREAVDGESETDGVIVRYIEPDFDYAPQPSAPWVNPIYFEEGVTPRYLTVEILACQDHNQAMRLAKAIGLRSQSAQRLAPTTGLRGLRARQERIVDLQYDSIFAGDYEIATPVEVDESGAFVQFGCVPVDANRWSLLEGEELSKPAPIVDAGSSGDPVLPTNVVVFAASVPGSEGAAVRIEATFDASPRADHRYEFQYKLNGESTWRPMVVRMDDQFAYSDTVPDGEIHEVRWLTVTTAGRATDYVDPVEEVLAIADQSAPDEVANATAVGGAGSATIEWDAPNSSNYVGARIYRHTADDFGNATLVSTISGAPNSHGEYEDSGLAADDYWYWLEAVNGSGIASDETATTPASVTVT
jgi:hypothetical protein